MTYVAVAVTTVSVIVSVDDSLFCTVNFVPGVKILWCNGVDVQIHCVGEVEEWH